MEGYLRTKFALQKWNKNADSITLVLTPDVVTEVTDERHFKLLDGPNGPTEIRVAVPIDSPIAQNLTTGKSFYLDLIPTEVAAAARTGSRV
jgi:hypothetical protein